MSAMRSVIPILVVLSCGGPAAPASSETSGSAATGTDDGDTGAPAETSEGAGSSATGSSDGADTEIDDASSGTASGEGSDSAGGDGPVELYRGPVDGGIVPGWDPDAPRPLVMLGREGDEWVATLARIDGGGALSDNFAEEIVVWGFTVDPTVLYDGPVGGVLDGWDPAAPIPLVMMGHDGADGSWVATLASIAPDGALSDNFADRIVVWGWAGAEPSAPDLRYEGPVAGGTLPGWNTDDPAPIVALGTPGFELWIATLVRIAPDGALSDNVATEIRIWGW
jgi:hypothetical protein